MRIGEAKALTWNDIDLDKKTISISKSVISKIKGNKFIITTPKTKNSIRTLPMPKNLLSDIKTLFKSESNFTNFNKNWFVFGGVTTLADTTIQQRKNNNCKKAGVIQIRIHDFRHSCASLLINNNANIMLVAKYLGHAKIDVILNTYSHLYKNQMEEIANLIDNL